MARDREHERERERIARERDDAGMIGRPDMWPRWPFLPVKRPVAVGDADYPYQCGLIMEARGYYPVEGEGGKIKVVRANLFRLPESVAEWEAVEVIGEFSSPVEMVAAGWIVD